MRINIYEEEMTAEVHLVRKEVPQEGGELQTFYGLRFMLESPEPILAHSTPEDDDRCAVTFWVRPEGLEFLAGMLQHGMARVEYERIALGQKGPAAGITITAPDGEVLGEWATTEDGAHVQRPT